MAPAFSSTRQAGAFAALLLVLLLSPVLVGKSLLPPREQIYASLTWRYCAMGFLHQQLFEEKSDIDIAFVGSSRMWAGLDPVYVQSELSKRLGHPATVRTLAWSWLGFDADYFITRDLLHNRKVRMIVFDDEFRSDDIPHVGAVRWFRYAEDAPAISGMPLRIRMSYYFASILGMPRNLLSLLRPNITEVRPSADEVHWANFFHAPNSKDRLGALTSSRWLKEDEPFQDFVPPSNVRPPDVLRYSPETLAHFRIAGPPTTSWQRQFAQEFAQLAKENGTKLVFLHLCPVYSSNERTNPAVEERERWPDLLGSDVTMLGVPPGRLYSGLSDDDYAKLFYTSDHCHYNKNGQAFFTHLITPALLDIYENPAAR